MGEASDTIFTSVGPSLAFPANDAVGDTLRGIAQLLDCRFGGASAAWRASLVA